MSILLPSMGVDVRGSADGGRVGRPTVARSSSSQSVCGEKGTLPPSPDLFVERRERERDPFPPLLLPFPDTIAPQIASRWPHSLGLVIYPPPPLCGGLQLTTQEAEEEEEEAASSIRMGGGLSSPPLPSFAPPSVRPSSFPLLPFSYTYLPTYSNSRAWKRRETTRLGL